MSCRLLLYPDPVQAAGGPEPLARLALKKLEAGKPVEALHLTDVVLTYDRKTERHWRRGLRRWLTCESAAGTTLRLARRRDHKDEGRTCIAIDLLPSRPLDPADVVFDVPICLSLTNRNLFLVNCLAMPEVAKRWNGAAWLALLLAVGALAQNFVFFVNPPLRAALPWLSLLLASAALVVLVIGLRRALFQPQTYRGKVSSIVLGVLILMFAGASLFVFYHARALPNSTAAPQVGQQLPDFALADTAGQLVSLDNLFASWPNDPSSPPPRAVLLIFYRGYW
jgi:hypothetical protein